MRKKLFACFLCLCSFFIHAQMPYIATPTVIPQNPTNNSLIKIITRVTTPNQSIIVNITSHTVTGQQIKISACYSQGMLPATMSFVDTLLIGQLPPGNYQISQKAFLSSTQQHCTPVDSNAVIFSLIVTNSVVTGTDAMQTAEGKTISLWPNPCGGNLVIENASDEAEVQVFSVSGALVKRARLSSKTLDTRDLENGFYFLRLVEKDRMRTGKFIKSGTGQ